MDADDIVEELFVKLWEQKKTFKCEDSCKYYLYKSARNLSLNFLKEKQRIFKKHDQAFKSADMQIKDHSHTLIRTEVLNQIINEIEKLPPQESKVLLMTLKDGLGIREIADELGLSLQTVKNCKYRATKKIQLKFIEQDKLSLLICFLLFCLK